jgi:hypothetical protein
MQRHESVHKFTQTNDDSHGFEQEAGQLYDLQGKAVDRLIVPVVAALRTLNFDTTASCQGHLDHGEPAPWVDVGVTPRRTELSDKAESRLRSTNLAEQARLLNLLDSFYRHNHVHSDVRLLALPFGVTGGFRITNQGAEVQVILPPSSRRKKLREYQREFQRFARFLTSRPPAVTKLERRRRFR